MKFNSAYSVFKFDTNNSGNGREIPQYFLDEKTKEIKPVLSDEGIQAVHSLYDDIQKNRNANDYKKALQLGVLDTTNAVDWQEQDFSEVGSFEQIQQSFNVIAEKTGKNVFELIEDYKTKLMNEKLQEVQQEVKQENKEVEGENK